MTTQTPQQILSDAGLRPTRQRLLLGEILFDGVNKHVTAESLHRQIMKTSDQSVSLATVYNTLASFTGSGLLRTVTLDGGCVYYDTNLTDHHHLYDSKTRELSDLAAGQLKLSGLPNIPEGKTLESVDIVIRIQ